jgi:hypothetical protein
MSTAEETLKNDIELAKGIGQLAESVNQAVTILAKAILELNDFGKLSLGTSGAIQSLAEASDV